MRRLHCRPLLVHGLEDLRPWEDRPDNGAMVLTSLRLCAGSFWSGERTGGPGPPPHAGTESPARGLQGAGLWCYCAANVPNRRFEKLAEGFTRRIMGHITLWTNMSERATASIPSAPWSIMSSTMCPLRCADA